MALNQKYKKSEAFLLDEDTYTAILYSIVDLGLHDSGFKDKETGEPIIQNKLALTFEFPDVKIPDGRPAAITREYSASLNEKAHLRALLTGLGRSEDDLNNENYVLSDHLQSVLGKPALVTIKHKKSSKGTTYANITQVAPLPKAMAKSVGKPTNKTVFIADVDSATEEDLASIPEFLRKKMHPTTSETVDDGEIPF